MTGKLSALACAVTATLVTLVGSGTQSIAAEPPPPPPDQAIDLPPGQACSGFELLVEIWGNPNRVFKEFKDSNGNPMRLLTAGKGNTLVFTNLQNGKKFFPKPNGSVEHITLNPDGSQTWATTGHNVLILFPTDVPMGPSTKQYVGRLVFTIDPKGITKLQSVSGNSTDICAELS